MSKKFDRRLWNCTKKILIQEIKKVEGEFNTQIKDTRTIREFLELRNYLIKGKTMKVHVDYLLYLIKVKEDKQIKEDKREEKRQVRENILDEISRKYIFATPTDTEELLLYKDGIYIEAKAIIKGRIEYILRHSATIGFCNEIIDHFKRRSYIDREEINKMIDYLPLINGLLNLKTFELEPHDPYNIFTFKLPTIYNLDAQCPKFLKAFNQILLEKDDRLLFQEYAGYTLLPDFPHHHLLFLVGKGRNGKGTLIRTLEGIIGKRNVSGIKLEDFSSGRRFVLARLYGKLMNICSEPRTRYELDTEIIKMVTGDDSIEAELKNIQKPLKFTSFAKFYIQANRLPHVADTTESWWDRVLIIKFDQRFTYIKGNRIPKVESVWLEDEEEQSGILNWMLNGLKRLINNQEFTISKTMKEQKIIFKQLSDTIGAFLEDETTVEYNSTFWELGINLYDAYKSYVEKIAGNIESVRVFNARLRLLPNIVTGQRRTGKKTHRGWSGIKVKNEVSDEFEMSEKLDFGEKKSEACEAPEAACISNRKKSKKTVTVLFKNNLGINGQASDASRASPSKAEKTTKIPEKTSGQDPKKKSLLLIKRLVKLWKRDERKYNNGFKLQNEKDLTLLLKGLKAGYVFEKRGGFWWFTDKAKEDIKR